MIDEYKKNKDSNFWEIIINKNKKYIFVFDQYKKQLVKMKEYLN